MSQQRRALLTGAGALCALGVGVDAFWEGLVSGRSGLAPIEGFDASDYQHPAAGEVRAIVSTDRRPDAASAFALAAAREALEDAGLDLAHTDRTRVAVVLATTLGEMAIGEAYQLARHRGESFPARRLLHFPYHALSSRLARALDVRGPVVSPSIACASGTHAVGLALEMIRAGQADVVVAGGAEALSPFVVGGFDCLRATASKTVKPFDAGRDGLLLGEGAAVVVVESDEHARARGRLAAVEIAGAGLAGDAQHITAPARDGSGAARAMRFALADADVEPASVGFISAHGTGTVYNDAMEVAAITAVFGAAARKIPVNSIKGAIGHTLGAAGTFESIMAARVITESVIPPTTGCERIDPLCTLDVVRGEPRRCNVDTVVSTSSAFAGNNAALVLRRYTR